MNPKHALTVLTRLCQRQPEHAVNLVHALKPRMDQLAETVVAVAVETGDPIGKIFTELFADRPSLKLARLVNRILPIDTIALRELKLEVTRQLLGDQQRQEEMDPLDLAGMYNTMAIDLSDVGKIGDASIAAQTAVRLCRSHFDAKESPEARACLAMCLHTLGNRNAKLARHREALKFLTEAQDHYQYLDRHYPQKYESLLTTCNASLTARLIECGQFEQALEINQAILDRYENRPKVTDIDSRDRLARTLNTHSNLLDALGQYSEALDANIEAVRTYRHLAQDRPDAFRDALVICLGNLANALAEMGEYAEGLEAAHEAVKIRRDQVRERSHTFRPGLASALERLSAVLAQAGNYDEAISFACEMVDIQRELVRHDRAAYKEDLARGLNTLANIYIHTDRDQQAGELIHEATNLYRGLLSERPEYLRAELARALHNQAIIIASLGRWETAFDAIDESIQLYHELAKKYPQAHTLNLAEGIGQRGLMLAITDRGDDAIAHITQALKLAATMVGHQPKANEPAVSSLIQQYREICRMEGISIDDKLVSALTKES